MAWATQISRKKKPDDQFQAELIGKNVQVVESTNPHEIGIFGKIVDEARSIIRIETAEKIKTLLKHNIKIKIWPEKSGRIIEGKKLAKRPEERLKP